MSNKAQKKYRLQIMINPNTLEELTELVDRLDSSLSTVAREAILEYLKKNKVKK